MAPFSRTPVLSCALAALVTAAGAASAQTYVPGVGLVGYIADASWSKPSLPTYGGSWYNPWKPSMLKHALELCDVIYIEKGEYTLDDPEYIYTHVARIEGGWSLKYRGSGEFASLSAWRSTRDGTNLIAGEHGGASLVWGSGWPEGVTAPDSVTLSQLRFANHSVNLLAFSGRVSSVTIDRCTFASIDSYSVLDSHYNSVRFNNTNFSGVSGKNVVTLHACDVAFNGCTFADIHTFTGCVDLNETSAVFTSSNFFRVRGPGVVVNDASDLAVSACRFEDAGDSFIEIADDSTAAVIASTFESGFATYGGAIYALGDLEVSDSIFARGTARSNGGAIYAARDLRVTDTLFTENTAADGGAIYLVGEDPQSPHPTECVLTRCTFEDNALTVSPTMLSPGSAVSASDDRTLVQITDSLFARNINGTALFLYEGGNLVDNCTFADNTNSVYVAGGTVRNSIFSGSGMAMFTDFTGRTATVTGCTVDATHPSTRAPWTNAELAAFGAGNVARTPTFMDRANGDYRLPLGSADIDTGVGGRFRVPGSIDLNGDPRFSGTSSFLKPVDRGCYEYQH